MEVQTLHYVYWSDLQRCICDVANLPWIDPGYYHLETNKRIPYSDYYKLLNIPSFDGEQYQRKDLWSVFEIHVLPYDFSRDTYCNLSKVDISEEIPEWAIPYIEAFNQIVEEYSSGKNFLVVYFY